MNREDGAVSKMNTPKYTKRIWTFGLCVFLAVLGVTTHSWAGQYDAQSIGKAIPLWMELSADVNEQGDVAWSQQVSGSPKARILLDGNTTSTALGSANVSTAHGLTERRAGVIWVAGSEAPTLRMNTRTAVLWRVDASGGGAPSITRFDLGAMTHQSDDGDPSGYVQQSAAYGIVEQSVNQLMVVGFARDKVSNNVLPQPVVWTVNYAGGNITATVSRLPGWESGPAPNGNATTISQNGDWVCGQGAQAGAYMQAACWSRSSGTRNTALNAALATEFGSIPVASVVNRVRSVDLANPDVPGGTRNVHTFAVGAAMIGGSQSGGTMNGGVWKGFAYDLTDGKFWQGFDFTDGGQSDSLLYDVAGAYFPNSAGARLNNGPVFGGTSATVGTGAGNLFNSGPTGMGGTNTMRAIFRNTISTPSEDNGVVCKVDEDSKTVGGSHTGQSYDQLVAMSADAHFRLAAADGVLYRLEQKKAAFEVEYFNRTTTTRTTSAARSGPVVLSQAKATNFASGAVPNQALVRFGNSLGCGTASADGIGSCGSNPAAFDIVSGKTLLFNTNIAGGLSTTKTATAFSIGSNPYVQGVTRTNAGNACTISAIASSNLSADVPVDAVSISQKSTTGQSKNTMDTDYDGTSWRYCGTGPEWINDQTDYDHCGGCDNTVQDSRGSCTVNRCSTGTKQAMASGNGCWIGGTANWSPSKWDQGQCVAEDQHNTTTSYRLINTRNEACGNASTSPVYTDPCSLCDSSKNTTNWSAITSGLCCNSGGMARLDAYDRNQSWCDDTQWSYDRNDGRVRSARWKDPRSGWIYDQDDDWSDGNTCLANGSGDPHSIIDPGTISGYTRSRRIDAFFTYPIDMEDWYEATFDDNGDSRPTPKPRARLISRKTYPGTSRRVRMQLCLYVDAANGDLGHVNIKDMRANRGINKTATQDGPYNSPAYDARGQCVNTDDSGVADIVVYDYDNTKNAKEDAYVHFVVRPLDNISNLPCQGTEYTLYYGNDKKWGQSAQSGYNANKTGCLDCCN